MSQLLPVGSSLIILLKWIALISGLVMSILVMYMAQSASVWLLWMLIVITVLSEFAGRLLFYSVKVSYGVYLLKR